MLQNHIHLLKQAVLQTSVNIGTHGWSDLEVIRIQGLLMSAGGLVCHTLYQGDMGKILSALTQTAYLAVEAIIVSGETQLLPSPRAITPLYELRPITQALCERICDCQQGRSEQYAALYQYCTSLSVDFLNADFGRAFETYHRWQLAIRDNSNLTPDLLPDLTDCLYE